MNVNDAIEISRSCIENNEPLGHHYLCLEWLEDHPDCCEAQDLATTIENRIDNHFQSADRIAQLRSDLQSVPHRRTT